MLLRPKVDEPAVVEPAEPVLEPVVDGPEDERPLDQAAAAEDPGEEVGRRLRPAACRRRRRRRRRGASRRSARLIAPPPGGHPAADLVGQGPRPSRRRPPRRSPGRSARCCSPGRGPSGRASRAGARRGGRPRPRGRPRVIRSQRAATASGPARPGSGYWSLTIANRGSASTSRESGSPVAASRSSTRAIADEAVADEPDPGVDHPAVPLAAEHGRLGPHPLDDVDLADRRPVDRAAELGGRASSVTREVERFMTTGPVACASRREAARARVSSSPM